MARHIIRPETGPTERETAAAQPEPQNPGQERGAPGAPAVAQKNTEEAQAALQSAIPTIARVAGKGTLHWRAAARKISRLTRQVNALTTPA